MLTETIDRLDPELRRPSEIGLIAGLPQPAGVRRQRPRPPEQAAGAIVRGMTRQVGNEIDEFVTEALRNNLLGLPLDLAGHQHRARPRHRHSVAERGARASSIADDRRRRQLKPYTSWADFAQHLKHPESLINFIAAYGTHAADHRRDDAGGQARRRDGADLRRQP